MLTTDDRARTIVAMFATTFLGHQGWLFQSKRACLLVDPLLCEPFGHTQALQYRVYPPRILRPGAFPPIDAVALTHEHDDHFDIPSLALLDRRIPIYLSARSSTAAHAILKTMGFTVHPLVPGGAVRVGDLELRPFAGDHVNTSCGDEWDTLPFLVRHMGGDGSFFSMVDIPLTQGHLDWARVHAQRPGLVSWTNNALDWSHMASYVSPRNDATQDCFVKMGIGHQLISTYWGAPSAMLFCAGGFAFEGERAWLNEQVFCVDTDVVCQMMTSLYPKEHFVSTRPGQTFWLEGNQLKRAADTMPFLERAPIESWPSRAKNAESSPRDYEPATGRHALDDDELPALARGLEELAAALVGGTVFRGLHSLLEDEAPGKKPTFAFALRNGDALLVFEYVPSACTFRPGAADPRRAYVAGLECWAPDLLAVLRGELGPIALTFGRARLWNALPQRYGFDLFGELYRVSHPLRRPAVVGEVYEQLWRLHAATEPVFTAR